MTEVNELEIVDVEAEDQAEDAVCREVCTKADYIDGLIDQFLDESPQKALAFVTAMEAAAHHFLREELARSFEVDQ